MHIDFTDVTNRTEKLSDLAEKVSKADLLAASNASVDAMLALLENATDADIVFDPTDDGAHDPYAAEGEETIGWSLGHLIAHVTSSSEEGAAFSSLLARGVEANERPRYETPWRDMQTVAHCRQRLEESRRMRNAYLDTWPDEPHLGVIRAGMSERFVEFTGPLNAVGCFLLGLWHEVGHFSQLQDAVAQAASGRG